MMLHAILLWPETINLELWPFAIKHAAYLWNNMRQKDTLLSPMLELSHRVACFIHMFGDAHVMFLIPNCKNQHMVNFSRQHSSMVGRILNLDLGAVTPHFHVVYDDLFTTVPNLPWIHIPDPSGQQPEIQKDLITPEGDQDLVCSRGCQEQDYSSVPEGDQQQSSATKSRSRT